MAFEQRLQPHQGAPASCPVQPVEHAISAPGGEGFAELNAAQATEAFNQLFAGLSERRSNQRIVEAAQLSHGADGVLRPVGLSPKKRGENLGEGDR